MSDLEAFRKARELLLEHRSDYARAAAEFRWPQLRNFNWALDHFDHLGRTVDRPALIVTTDRGDETVRTFADLSRRSNQLANLFRSSGLLRGDRVLLMLGNVPALWEVFLACMKLGLVIVPATTLLARADIEDRVLRGGVRHVVAEPACVDKLRGLTALRTVWLTGETPRESAHRSVDEAILMPEEFTPDRATDADETLLLYFTSGTTAKPKLVTHTHTSYPVGHLSTMYWIGLQPGDVHWNISSPGWAKHAWSNIFAPWNAGATVFVHVPARFSAKETLEVLERRKVTTLCAPPTVWRMLVLEDLATKPASLRECVAAGEPLNPEVISTVERAWGITVRDGFGQTETSALVGNTPGQRVVPGSMGKALPGFRIEMLDHDGAPGDDGELSVALAEDVRPVGVMAGYADDDALWSVVSRGGYYHTGDVARRDEAGMITYVGRADDVFKSSDYRISPFELESVLVEHPLVAEAAIVPSPDPVRLSVPKAFVVLTETTVPTEALARDILAFVRERVSPYKRVKRLEFVRQETLLSGPSKDLPVLPKTVSGKIRRVEMRVAEAARDLAAGPRAGEVWE